MGTLPVLAVLIMVILGALRFWLDVPSEVRSHEVLWFVRDFNVVLIGVSAVFFVLFFFVRLIYRFQVFFSTAMAGLALVVVYTMCLMCLCIATLPQKRTAPFSATWFSIGGCVALLVLVGATTVHVLMLRHRLRVGHSQERTIGNYIAASGSNRSKILWITFGVVAVVPNVLTSGEYLANSFGALALVFFACVTPSLPVEFAYLAYLKAKDRIYWEARPPRMPVEERRRLIRKIVLWVVGIAVAIAAFWIFATNFRAGV